jgi:hypothetical protein
MIIALLFAASFSGCGSERVLVKNLLDKPNLVAPQAATVEQLLRARPPRWSRDSPRHRVEHLVVRIEAEVLAYKDEADGDIHAIIRGGRGALMVVEFPNALCTAGSPFAAQMDVARRRFLLMMHRHVARLRFTGVIFFDKVHGQSGGAFNGVELHPVLQVEESNQLARR